MGLGWEEGGKYLGKHFFGNKRPTSFDHPLNFTQPMLTALRSARPLKANPAKYSYDNKMYIVHA